MKFFLSSINLSETFMSLVLRLLYKILIHRKNLIRIHNKDIFTLLLVSEDVLGPTVNFG